MIRDKLFNEISQIISDGMKFDLNDFEIFSEKQSQGSMLMISYRFSENFNFKVNIPNKKTEINSYETDYIISGVMTPGELALNEEFKCIGKKKLFQEIADWLQFVESELISLPIKREFDEQMERIKKLEKLVEQVSDECISKEDGVKFAQALDDLEKKFSERLNDTIADQQELKKQINQLASEISILKNTIYSLTKKNWLRSLLVRCAKWGTNPENKQILSAGITTIKALLPDSVPQEIADMQLSDNDL